MDADKIANESESMFLPETLMYEFQTAQIDSPSGQTKKLVTEKKVLVNKKYVNEQNDSWLLKPTFIACFMLFLGILLTIWDIKEGRRHYKFFDTLIFALTGLGGLIAFYLMFFSLHPLVKNNLNLLWLNPLNFFIAIMIWVKPLRVILFFYQILNILFLVGALFAFALSIQVFNLAAFPLIVLLLMRSSSWFALTKRKIYKNKKI